PQYSIPTTPMTRPSASATRKDGNASRTPSSGRLLSLSSVSIAPRSWTDARRIVAEPCWMSEVIVLGPSLVVWAAASHFLHCGDPTGLRRPNERAHDPAVDLRREGRGIEARPGQEARRVVGGVHAGRLDRDASKPRVRQQVAILHLLERTGHAA